MSDLAEILGAATVEIAHVIVMALSEHYDGDTTMAQVLAELSTLKEQIAETRKATDAALHARFSSGPNPTIVSGEGEG